MLQSPAGPGSTGTTAQSGVTQGKGGFVSGQSSALCEKREPHPGAMPGLVRLTHRQYGFAVRDLFGVDANATAEFVSDQEFYGFNNNAEKLGVAGNQVSRYQLAAESIAAQVAQEPDTLATVVSCVSAKRDDACRDQLLGTLLKLMFRRPLSEPELTRYRKVFAAGASLYEEGDPFARGMRIVIETALQSPLFLYRGELGDTPLDGKVVELSNFELAARLSLLLWSSVPDAALMSKAEAGKLTKSADLEAEVRRMLDDPRAERVVEDFFTQWLELGKLRFEKDPDTFPSYDKARFEAAAKSEALTFARQLTLRERGTIADLFTSPVTFVNATAAEIYGVSAPGGGEPKRVSLDPTQRAGVFTQLAFLAGHADAVEGSPIHRGAFMVKRVLCRELGPPVANVGSLPPRGGNIVTMRDQVEAKTSAAACMGCHEQINPLGFAFESFDGLGRFRSEDHGAPVDTTGLLSLDDRDTSFDDAVQLGQKLAASETAKRCYELQWFRYAYGRKEAGEDDCVLHEIDQRVRAKNYDLRELLVAIATSRAFRFRAQEEL